ncbi:MAG TPA: ferritin-like domain-containing protein [Thermoleophilaceae bacterium]|nr:ferritin-like domain-containing protein [Thermoleophilaceae bacterium]
MSDLITLDLVDSDGAIRDAEDAVAGDTRADFFRKAALGGGALLGGSVLLSGFPMLADAKPSIKQDVKILNYALTLEYLENAFYVEALAKAGLTGDAQRAAQVIQKHEQAHVEFLRKALGKAAIKKPKFAFGDATSNQAKFLATAVVLEDTGVSAYAGQATRIKQVPVVKAALSIHSVEARHAAFVRELAGQSFAPRAFDRAANMNAVLKKAGPFIA